MVKGINAGARELPRAGARRADRARPGARRQGPRLGLSGGRRVALADREVPLRRRSCAALNERSAPPRATCCWSSPTSRRSRARYSAQLRLELAERFELIDPDGANAFCWIVDWPLFEWNDEEERWDPLHHPFTAPEGELDPERPGRGAGARLRRGLERPGARRRLDPDHRPGVQERVLEAARDRRRGGGGAVRLPARGASLRRAAARRDRLRPRPDGAARCCGADSIRDVIAFPKTASGADPLTGAPAPVDEAQLRELGHSAARKRSDPGARRRSSLRAGGRPTGLTGR